MGGKVKSEKDIIKSFASKIKANSLSDIESINSDGENDEIECKFR